MNRNILKLLVLLSFLLTSGIVRSQGFAGGDKSAFFDPNVGKAVVTLGSSDYASDVYYRWDYVSEVSNGGAFDINDQFASRPELTFHNPGEYVFRCTQISKYGHKSEYVVVTVQSKIDLVSVRLKENHNCFLNGYVLSTNDFEIETFPEDGKDYIEVAAPDVINVATHGAWPFQIHEVGFTSIDENGDRYDCDLKCKIPVIDDNRYVSYDKMKKNLKTISSDMEENVDLLEESFGSLTRLNCFSNPAYILPPALYSMVNPQGNGGMLSAGIQGMNFLNALNDVLGIQKASPITFNYKCQFNELGLKYILITMLLYRKKLIKTSLIK